MKRFLMSKLVLSCFLSSATLLTGCATIFSGAHQDVTVKSSEPALNEHLKLVAITDKNRVKKYPVLDAEMDVHRTALPFHISIEETECIRATTESYDSGVNPVVILDFLATSLLSSSIDSSTGAFWDYDDTVYVHPLVKDTPECNKWKEELQKEYLKKHPVESEEN